MLLYWPKPYPPIQTFVDLTTMLNVYINDCRNTVNVLKPNTPAPVELGGVMIN